MGLGSKVSTVVLCVVRMDGECGSAGDGMA